MQSIGYIATLFVFFACLIGLALVLGRYRDRITQKFVKGPMVLKGMMPLGDGARLCLIECEGVTVLCGVGKNGVGSIQIIEPVKKEFSL